MRRFLFFWAALLAPACQASNIEPKVIVYGDSFSAGSGRNLKDPHLWPNVLEGLLDQRGSDWTVVNRSINGNGLVWRTRCFGQPALERLNADLPSLVQGEIIIIMAGINDVIQPALPSGFSSCFDPGDFPAKSIVGPLDVLRRSAHGRRILLATIPPFSASKFHTAAAEQKRTDVNHWITAHWPKRDLVNLDKVLASGIDTAKLNPKFDSGDGLHPNGTGAVAIANAVAELMQ